MMKIFSEEYEKVTKTPIQIEKLGDSAKNLQFFILDSASKTVSTTHAPTQIKQIKYVLR